MKSCSFQLGRFRQNLHQLEVLKRSPQSATWKTRNNNIPVSCGLHQVISLPPGGEGKHQHVQTCWHSSKTTPKQQDPFETHRLVDYRVSYPCRSPLNITFQVDDSPSARTVRRALSDATNVFAYEGTVYSFDWWDPTKWMPLFDDINLSDDEKQAVKTILEQKELPIDALLKVATPASFGRYGKTVFDPEVRKAFEIPRSKIPQDLLKVLELDQNGRYDIEWAMKPKSKKWVYQLYKIHMYGPGGKFEDHVDTLHQNNHVATVVLSLPSKHVGGTLRIQHHGETMEFDSSKGPENGRYHGIEFCYAAFFTDCTHSVQEVISGWRVVVQYDVYEEDVVIKNESDGDQGSRHVSKARVEEVSNCLENNRDAATSKLRNKEQAELVQAVSLHLAKIPPTHGVAFFLRHRYSLPALDENVLKGADRTIYDAFSKRKDLAVSIQGVLVYIETEYMDHVSLYVSAVSMKELLPADSSDATDGENSDATDGENSDATDGECTNEQEPANTVHLIVDSKNGAMCVHETGQTGNEPADGYTSYFVACMIVRSVENLETAAAEK